MPEVPESAVQTHARRLYERYCEIPAPPNGSWNDWLTLAREDLEAVALAIQAKVEEVRKPLFEFWDEFDHLKAQAADDSEKEREAHGENVEQRAFELAYARAANRFRDAIAALNHALLSTASPKLRSLEHERDLLREEIATIIEALGRGDELSQGTISRLDEALSQTVDHALPSKGTGEERCKGSRKIKVIGNDSSWQVDCPGCPDCLPKGTKEERLVCNCDAAERQAACHSMDCPMGKELVRLLQGEPDCLPSKGEERILARELAVRAMKAKTGAELRLVEREILSAISRALPTTPKEER